MSMGSHLLNGTRTGFHKKSVYIILLKNAITLTDAVVKKLTCITSKSYDLSVVCLIMSCSFVEINLSASTQRCIKSTSMRRRCRIDVDTMLFRRHIPAGQKDVWMPPLTQQSEDDVD